MEIELPKCIQVIYARHEPLHIGQVASWLNLSWILRFLEPCSRLGAIKGLLQVISRLAVDVTSFRSCV
jgi:hypothetical protein